MRVPSPHSPFRDIDWRSRRSLYLVESGKRPSRRDDQWTWWAWRFFRALAHNDDELQRERVRRRWPHHAAAVEIHKSADGFSRWELEARLLAREPIGVIAGRLSLAPEAVEAYVAIFFDVLGVLNATDFVILRIIGLSPSRAFTEKDVEVWLKFFGYVGGPCVLDSLLDFYLNPEFISDGITQVDPTRRARVIQHLTIRASILMHCMRDGDTRSLALESLVKRLEAERRNGGLAGDGGEALPPLRPSLSVLEELWKRMTVSKAAPELVAG